MELLKKSFIVFCLIWAIQQQSFAQQICTGSFGDPVINIDFGRGTSNFGPSLGSSTSYRYVGFDHPEDGEYAIAKSTNGMLPNAWFQIPNHTPNDPDGYMMIVNANYETGIFYEAEVNTDLCPNTTYQFAAWVINLLKYDGRKPRLVFSILTTDNQVLGSKDTGDIPEGTATDWKQYSLEFTTPANVNRIKIRIANNGPGGGGNDIALDDITFRACGPEINTSINNEPGTATETICEHQTTDIHFSATVNGPATATYIWQKNEGSGWVDLAGETGQNLTVHFANAVKGTYQYRLALAANQASSASCRTASAPLTVQVNPLPVPVVEPVLKFCPGENIVLNVTGVTGTYLWSGPNHFSSTAQSPVIPAATSQMAGVYTVEVATGSCSSFASTQVEILAPPAATVDNPHPIICQGTETTLQAHGGSVYSWSPALGLSNPAISNPIAKPDVTTLYTVSVSDGACVSTAQVLVTVLDKVVADAGPDQKIRKGQSVQINGKVSGDQVRYLWTPSTGLDNPEKLQPVATPEHDMTYTLQATSDAGCLGSVSSVFVRVLEKIVIPNAFSPNGDNINDVWYIEALETYPKAELKVVDRYGNLVFEGTKTPWDGRYKGNDVPAGVYFYILNLNEEGKRFSGSIMIIR
ncbi:hypothetical protein DBR11_17195 [Pedobacter sp. HMWF019]|uniref:T9SS type B sorting domain-containing protein n=1 Tax=Pedobacter sp. HMWF019 TaxID=2056856 RepID=UPI000D3883FC|nr:gliding motility-associated C-terminal domain-containing protein [Pedobacter sp. HMWF019]PTS97396.1 hypothetical protein DBR11_17195 [Pedobacter sp. HMWF019]